jgi:hypothetical protein
MTALDLATADRLAKLLGMLGSNSDGERAAAGRLADQLLRARGLTWKQVISVMSSSMSTTTPARSAWTPNAASSPTAKELIEHALAHGDGIHSAWECEFLRSIRDWPSSLTERQRRKLESIVAKVAARGMPA